MAQAEAATISGTVARTNDSGLQLDSSATWLNYTTQRPLPHAAKGDQVTLSLGLDNQGAPKWINAIEINSQAQAATSTAQATPSNGNSPAERDVLMARCSALKSATALATSGDQDAPRSLDVLAVASLYAAWLLGTLTDHELASKIGITANGHAPAALPPPSQQVFDDLDQVPF